MRHEQESAWWGPTVKVKIGAWAHESVLDHHPSVAPLLHPDGRGLIFICSGCALIRSGQGIAARIGASAMLAHLSEHERYGHRVPPKAYRWMRMLAYSERGAWF